MLGPSSFRSQQPVKSSLKTYRSRGKRTTAFARSSDTSTSDHKLARQFDWDRLAQERKARIENARVQAQRRREAQLEQEAEDAQLVAALYSDPPSDEALSQESEAVMVVPSTQGSDDELAYPSYTDTFASASARNSSVSFSIPTEATTRMRQALQREKTFSEQDYEEDDPDEMDGEDGQDEVLFRSPSFDLLKRLREIPKPQFPEPRTSTFGFGLLSGPGSDSSADAGPVSASDPPSLPSAAIHTHDPKNPFLILESPKIKKTMDIFQRRRQQLTELQNRRKSTSERPKGSAGLAQDPDLSMETDTPSNLQQRQQRRDMASFEREKSEDVLGLESVRDYVAPKRNLRQTTPEPRTPKDTDGDEQDDCVDRALGKRMSSIEITPRRMMAKQRKLAAQDPVSPTRPDRTMAAQRGAGRALVRTRRTEPLPQPPPKLYLDRDPPATIHNSDEFDFLFNPKSSVFKSRSQSTHSLSSSEPIRPTSLESPYEWQRPSPTLNTKKAPIQSMDPQQRSKMNQDQRNTTVSASSLRRQELKDGCGLVFDDRPLPSQLKARSATSREDPIAMLPLEQQERPSSRQQSTDTYEEGTKRPQAARQVRSLRRPPAVLVSHRNKGIFRPTLEDLLAISDQRFFEQFRDADSSSASLASVGDKENRPEQEKGATTSEVSPGTAIVDFESLLPECMAKTLTKIGEASYSEVYTVDLPVQQQRQHRLEQSLRKKKSWSHYSRGGRQGADDEAALFQSPRLNSYVKESAEDDLTPQTTDSRNGATGGERTRLVMKIMPFNTTGDGSATDSERTRKSRGRTRSESDLLALEDIYREARVSTQIMHGWKGFIGSFGALVVRGRYPKPLLAAWDRFRKANGTESWRPDIYPKNQLYCIILLPYGGTDLERCPLANWKQAWSVLTQIAASLESKEQAPYWFEHRDLHWGNILVKGTRQESVVFARRDVERDNQRQEMASSADLRARQEHRTVPTFGIVVQMIDFTLARVQGDKGNLIYMDLEKDQDLFRGQGDYQFEIYRKMRKQIGKDWAASCPRTNLYWLHYIADKLVNEKELEVPRLYPSSNSREKIAVVRRPSSFSSSNGHGMVQGSEDDDEQLEAWCYSRVLAVLKMYPDRLDPCGQTPSGTVLDLLLHEGGP
ncbi:hypothetical protein BGZ70_008875 [Mortierella alpina]|uniref:non-specific serine/threonine protein kinase n=1 Tax=Mortierella alpina TaxID=64518 RepID=A0A9P6J2Y1_MORAP|nr:hypothetical protein BGZ70_008875 [Mortierella alpina]